MHLIKMQFFTIRFKCDTFSIVEVEFCLFKNIWSIYVIVKLYDHLDYFNAWRVLLELISILSSEVDIEILLKYINLWRHITHCYTKSCSSSLSAKCIEWTTKDWSHRHHHVIISCIFSLKMKDDLEASNNVPSIQHLIRQQGEENFEQKLGLISIL